jgi:hypothetical protein
MIRFRSGRRLPWCRGLRRHQWVRPGRDDGPRWCMRCAAREVAPLTYVEAHELLLALRTACDFPETTAEAKLLTFLCAEDEIAAGAA